MSIVKDVDLEGLSMFYSPNIIYPAGNMSLKLYYTTFMLGKKGAPKVSAPTLC